MNWNLVLLLLLTWASVCLASEDLPKNVLLICVDDLRPELGCFGRSYIQSPNIDRLAQNGIAFQRHYVQAPTCGASRYALLTGTFGGRNNAALFQRAKQLQLDPKSVSPSMPAWFRNHGYTTVSVGKVSHHPGGRGGKDWDDDAISEMPNSWDRHLLPAGAWKHPRGWMHGLANGEIRKNAKEMDLFQAVEGPDSIYPDGGSIDEALRQLSKLSSDKSSPFFLAVGILRPHLPFGAPKKYLDLYKDTDLPKIPHPEKPTGKTTWHASGEFMKYNRWNRNPNHDDEFATLVRKHYAACVSYADAQVGRLMAGLKQNGVENDTIVILWGDHGWHLGEHSIWGKHSLFEESLRSPLIVNAPGINQQGSSNAIVETVDLFPTLCELTELPLPDFLVGQSLLPLLKDPDATGDGSAVGYYRNAKTIRTASHRLIVHQQGQIELYSHASGSDETENIAADFPGKAASLIKRMNARLPD